MMPKGVVHSSCVTVMYITQPFHITLQVYIYQVRETQKHYIQGCSVEDGICVLALLEIAVHTKTKTTMRPNFFCTNALIKNKLGILDFSRFAGVVSLTQNFRYSYGFQIVNINLFYCSQLRNTRSRHHIQRVLAGYCPHIVYACHTPCFDLFWRETLPVPGLYINFVMASTFIQ